MLYDDLHRHMYVHFYALAKEGGLRNLLLTILICGKIIAPIDFIFVASAKESSIYSAHNIFICDCVPYVCMFRCKHMYV